MNYLLLVLLAAGLMLLTWWDNKRIVITEYTVSDDRIPACFDGFRLVQISDLHNGSFGKGNKRLLEAILGAGPDTIAVTGDIIYGRDPKPEIAVEFIRGAAKIAPVYYVPGNHEARLDNYPQLREALRNAGAVILENNGMVLGEGENRLLLLGLMDPRFFSENDFETDESLMAAYLAMLTRGQRGYRILLSHRPELFGLYADSGIDLSLTGHAHGGQIRIPGIGGLFAPGQGFFPRLTSGLHSCGNSRMIVSRGLGKSAFPLRILNPPEVTVVQLKRD